MSHGKIQRVTIGFPGLNEDGSTFIGGIPGPEVSSGGVMSPEDRSTFIGNGITTGYIQDPKKSYRKITLPKVRGMQLSYLGIAPDSAIHSADIALQGEGGAFLRGRISPGNPLLGCQDADWALVSVPNSLVGVPASSNSIVGHDIVGFRNAGASLDFGGWPLRLELGYGSILPVRSPERAVYVGHFLGTPASGQSRTFRICVDGRRRIDVACNSSGGTSTLTAFALESFKTQNAPLIDTSTAFPLPLDDAGSTSLAIGSALNVSFFGNPISILELVVAQTVATGVIQLHVKAYDY